MPVALFELSTCISTCDDWAEAKTTVIIEEDSTIAQVINNAHNFFDVLVFSILYLQKLMRNKLFPE